MRLNRTEYFLGMAELAAKRGTCPRLQVGCVLAYKNRVKATGYNGSFKGSPHCDDAGCILEDHHCVRTLHAEVNAVLSLERGYDQLNAYVTHVPCINCYRILAGANITAIYYTHEYGSYSKAYEQLVKEMGVQLINVQL